jgi:cytochrome P450
LEGHETTASTLGWAFRLLALHPDVQEKVAFDVLQEMTLTIQTDVSGSEWNFERKGTYLR